MISIVEQLFEADCLRERGRALTGVRAHYCPEWDFMPIDETCKEIEACICTFKHSERS